MNKRDVADIVFAAIGVVFIFTFAQSLMGFAYYLGLNDKGAVYTDKLISIVFSALHSIVLAGVCYLLLFRRDKVLDLLFRGDSNRAVTIPEQMTSITRYSFWIRLIGAYMCLKAGTTFFGLLTITLASKNEYSSFSYNGMTTWQSLIVALLSVLVIYKADFIASIIEKNQIQEP